MLSVSIYKLFAKELKNASLNSTNTAKLFLFIALLLNEEALPKEARDHALLGGWEDAREFHISGDLLIYLIVLSKADEKFHITEKLFIKEVGKTLGFSESAMNELLE